ncbi:MAG: 16S rRNA (cytosine(1402)-N(4))-methyltransferase RsmH [Candidatus Margulisbacteria bacterium]|nr:16S rRNA (cytosine(1402)-N(4))-methyltransferase RsmH [Candidatus Margulisiibacteriota bacterium]
MSDNAYHHIPVLLKESIDLLNVKEGGTYVDCTLGGGGHAEAILKGLGVRGQVLGIDTDLEAIEAAKKRLAAHKNIKFVHDNFKNLKKILTEKVDGILLDLGVSSYQIDQASRGFSIREDGPLDMRMDQSLALTAETIINQFGQEELVKIFSEYGEERFSKRIAKAIVVGRATSNIKTTFQLKEIIEKAIPTWKKRESVSRIFQSLRIFINQELDSLKTLLNDAVDCLNPGGRIVVISYHSLEDRIVKQTFRAAKADGKMNLLTKKPLRATEDEISSNPRAKSAKLRAGEII